ncbi:MAG: hypothetical protein ACUVSF_11500 [Anaerolineae bacterium]
MRRDATRLLGAVLLMATFGLGLLLAALVTLAAVSPQPARASDPIKTGYVVVRFGPYDSMVRAFTFTQPISSYVALQRAGLNPAVAHAAWGSLLCGVDGVGKANRSGDGCDNGRFFWSTWYWDGTQWVYPIGLRELMIDRDGHIHGLVWTDQWPTSPPPYGAGAVAAYRALEWLRAHQDEQTGGYGTPNDTVEALLAVTANHENANTWRRGADKPSLLSATLETATNFQHAAEVGKLVTALSAAGSDQGPTAQDIMAYYDAATGTFNPNPGFHAWAMIGLRALNQSVPAEAVLALKAMQNDDGGWEYGTWSSTSDTNGTAIAIQALIAAGELPSSAAVAKGLDYLDGAQNADGGFPYDPKSPYDTTSDTNSTAYVVQALIAAGEDPTADRWKAGNNHPIAYLIGMQLADGAFEWQPGQGANQLATQQAIPALLYRPFPFIAAGNRVEDVPPTPSAPGG